MVGLDVPSLLAVQCEALVTDMYGTTVQYSGKTENKRSFQASGTW